MAVSDSRDPDSSFLFHLGRNGKGPHLQVLRDRTERDGRAHMALDEALLLESVNPILRFYTWPRAEISIGFFTPIAKVAGRIEPVTRRWTGGGVVEHGEDVTFSLAVPRNFLGEKASAGERYRQIHEALAAPLRDAGLPNARTAPIRREESLPGAASPGFCFSEPVAWDVVDSSSGAKLAGGAQRRSRRGLLHQGSIRLPSALRSLDHQWLSDFAGRLCGEFRSVADISEYGDAVLKSAERLRQERYDSLEWQQRF